MFLETGKYNVILNRNEQEGITVSIEKIEVLHEQTAFLLEKQKELLQESQTAFDSVIDLVDQKIKKVEGGQNAQDLQDLQFIHDHIAKQKEVLNEPIEQDVSFLHDQLKAIEKIKDIKDPEKAKELLDMIVEEDANLLETSVFKEQVNKDLDLSKKDLDVMIGDLKDAINEENWHTLKLTLEAMESVEENEDGCCGGSCDAENCKPDECNTCDSCSECSGVDIFEALKDLDEEDKKS